MFLLKLAIKNYLKQPVFRAPSSKLGLSGRSFDLDGLDVSSLSINLSNYNIAVAYFFLCYIIFCYSLHVNVTTVINMVQSSTFFWIKVFNPYPKNLMQYLAVIFTNSK